MRVDDYLDFLEYVLYTFMYNIFLYLKYLFDYI